MKTIDELRLLQWAPRFHQTLTNPSAPGGAVDLWEMIDDGTGETIVGVSVPPGRSDIIGYIAACCGNPVRWVTAMPSRPDMLAHIVADPGGALERETSEIADVFFAAYSDWMRRSGKPQANGWTLNDAIARLWFAFNGQLRHDMRALLLFKFMQLATCDYRADPVIDPRGEDHNQSG